MPNTTPALFTALDNPARFSDLGRARSWAARGTKMTTIVTIDGGHWHVRAAAGQRAERAGFPVVYVVPGVA